MLMIDINQKAIQEHKDKMQKIYDEMNKAKSRKRYLELRKCYHRLEKELVFYISRRYADEVIIKR